MITHKFIPEKVQKLCERYRKLRFEDVAGVPMEYWETKEHFRREPTARDGAKWRPAKKGTRWGGEWISAWFRAGVRLPAACVGKRVFLRVDQHAETLLLVDHVPNGTFGEFHSAVMIALKGKADHRYHVNLEAYAGHYYPGTGVDPASRPTARKWKMFNGAFIALERGDVTAFLFDALTLLQLAEILDDNSLRKGRILHCLAEVFSVVDAMPAEMPEFSWRPKLAEARRIMRPLLEARNGSTAPLMAMLGNSHLDTAWLWPIAETCRKAARTFSSVVNLMDQYPELTFFQSAPCHTEMVRQLYPELFERIRKRVASGQWEPNGCMWVEPDGNIPSGEAFIRQILAGQAWWRKHFNRAADTLWLPDTFGYSANLPQILKGCGVDYFCTQKIGWNDTTRFPYDTFNWHGIDGTRVLTHFVSDYVGTPDPKALTREWNKVQHKDVQDRRLFMLGYGDGGGGPTNEMLEFGRRVKDLEGLPRTEWSTASAFLRKMERELTDLPEWIGELYLEAHRGTLTSIAKIKRGNRKAEFALRDAEIIASLAALRGAAYPATELEELWKDLLILQFHDILPGSSIDRVNDEAIAAFAELQKKTHALRDRMLDRVCAPNRKSKDQAILLVNTLSWRRGGELVLDGVPAGMIPEGENVIHQAYTDVEGRAKLAVLGIEAEPLSGRAIPLARAKRGGQPKSPFIVTRQGVITPFASIRFNKAGCITSMQDKASGRELVKKGGMLAYFMAGENVPLYWDNWDVNPDQHLKMGIQGHLLSRVVVASGPLQLRIRSSWKVGTNSTLTQDMVFHSTTPRVDFETLVDWNETHQLLKACFDLNILADSARHEIQFGHVERPTHFNQPDDRARFEVCAHKWTDLSENGFGAALLNDCKYGVSVLGTTIGLTLMKAGMNPDPRGDKGRHLMTYALMPHNTPFSVESVVRPAYEINVPLITRMADVSSRCFGAPALVDAPNVIIEAIKWAEGGDGFVLRLYEAGKTATKARVSLNVPVREVCETTHLEEQPRKLRVRDGAVDLDFRAFEIKTLLCKI